MDVAYPYELIQLPPFNQHSSAVNGHKTLTRWSPLGNLLRLVTSSGRSINGWLRQLLSRSRNDSVSPIQTLDPYLESMLMALYDERGRRQ